MIAGFLAALTLTFDRSRKRRITIAIFSLARSFASTIKILDTNDIVKENKRWPVALLCMIQIYLSVTFHFYYDAFPRSLDKPFMHKLSGPDENDFILVEMIQRPRRYLGLKIL